MTHLSSPLPRYFFVLMWFLSVNLAGQDYLWPTNASRNLTSTFCEFRPRHYHAAIDIKTWQRGGYKVFAIADGYVYRLRVSANGYGKVVYLKLRDGNYVVYAHLSGFVPRLQEFGDSLRMASRNNVLDAFPEPPRFPVKRGELLGYTGSTGIGVPHLHFEIRNSANQPINPLQFYQKSIPDRIAPRVRSLAVIPFNAATLINQQPDTLILPVANGSSRLPAPIELSGSAYLAVLTSDLADGVGNQLDIYRAELRINDSLIYQVRYDRFDYGQTQLIELDKNFSLWRRGLQVYHNLYRHPANSLPFYGKTPAGAGSLSARSLHEGRNRFTITVHDFGGNSREVQGEIIYRPAIPVKVDSLALGDSSVTVMLSSPRKLGQVGVRRMKVGSRGGQPVNGLELHPLASRRDSAFRYQLTIPQVPPHDSGFYEILPTDSAGIAALAVLIPSGAATAPAGQNRSLRTRFFRRDLGIFFENEPPPFSAWSIADIVLFNQKPPYCYLSLPVDSLARLQAFLTPEAAALLAGETVANASVFPGTPRAVHSDDGRLRLYFPAGAAYDTLNVRIRRSAPPMPLKPPYRYLSEVYDAQPFDQPLNYGAELTMTLSDSLSRQKGLGIYYWDNRKGWLFLPTRHDLSQNDFQARVTSLEKFVAILDTVPPRLEALRLAGPADAPPAEPLLFSLVDEMAGIYKEEQITVTVDGRWTIFEYDPEENLLKIPSRFIPAGEHRVQISVTDNAGNRVQGSYTVRGR